MKLILFLALFYTVCASPLTKVIENVKERDHPRYALVPDTDGHMYLADLDAEDIAPLFNANTDTFFVLFTRRNPLAGQIISFDAAGVRNSNFDPSRPTRFIVHGWNNNGGSDVNIQIRDAYLRAGEFNVIVVDWGAGAQTINYISARNRVNEVGPLLARFIDFLVGNSFTTFNQVNIAGHSLGAHIAGIAGKRVILGRINTIFGLDPALPLFSMNAPMERFDTNDAVYTEGMHTNAGMLGFGDPLAQATFYPNFGRSQPGCGIDLVGNCAHGRATALFAESIWNNNFVSTRCANYAEITNNRCTPTGASRRMGGEPGNSENSGVEGVFHLVTNGVSPFARGDSMNISWRQIFRNRRDFEIQV